jgi:dienelactone hydrolase
VRLLVLSFGVAAAVACGTSAGHAPILQPKLVTGSFPNGDVSLKYLLERPAGNGPFPAIVMGHGSGEARKEFYQPFANQLLARGYAVLRYDKRGVGESTGTYSMVGVGNSEKMFADLASDMAAGVNLLRTLRDIDGTRIGLMGVSQAGWIIPLAAKASHPQFMILVVGPTVTVGQEIYYSRFSEGTATPFAELSERLRSFKGPHGFDPRPVLEELTTPGLWILGGVDRSIPNAETVDILDQLISKGKPYARVIFPAADHGLQGANIWPEIDRWLEPLVKPKRLKRPKRPT